MVCWISCNCAAASSSPQSDRSTSKARRFLPFFTNQRGTFRQDHPRKQEHQRRRRDRREHPAPAVLAVPRLADELRGGVVRHPLGNQPIGGLPDDEPDEDGQLVDRHEPSAETGRRHLGDVHRRDVRGHADGHAAQQSPHHEPGERRRPTGQRRGSWQTTTRRRSATSCGRTCR